MEAPKSKFVYPDKLYARCNNNKTLDISYLPQNMEAVEYTRTDAFVEKACEWLKKNIENYYYLDEAYDQVISIKRILEDFPKAMEK